MGESELDSVDLQTIRFANDRLPAHDMQDSSGLVDKILTDNRSQRQTMLAAITSGEAIAFVGAGLSVPLGYGLSFYKDLDSILTISLHGTLELLLQVSLTQCYLRRQLTISWNYSMGFFAMIPR